MRLNWYSWIYLALTGFTIYLTVRYHNTERIEVIWTDAEGYHMYLPAVFYYGNFEDIPVKTGNLEFRKYPGTNKYFTKFTYGVALLQSPTFLAAMTMATLTGNTDPPNDGIYTTATIVAGFIYGWLGMLMLILYLNRRFPKWIVLLTVSFVFFGTNLYYYWIAEAGASHVYSFFLLAAMLLLSYKLESFSRWWHWCLLGLAFGLLVLIRPTNLIAGALLLFLNVHNREQLRQRFQFLFGQWRWILAMAAIAALLWVPQMVYWHHVTGNWFMWSYSEEGFTNWNSPKIGPILTSEFNGVFIFTPLAAVMLIGSIVMLLTKQRQGWLYLGLFAIMTYIFSSWHAWSFGLSFGHRAYIEWYAVLALPLAWLLKTTFRARLWLGILTLGICTLFTWYTLELTYAYRDFWGWGERGYWSFDMLWDVIDREMF